MQLSGFACGNRYSALAQSVEHSAVNRSVVGSSPTSGATFHEFRFVEICGSP